MRIGLPLLLLLTAGPAGAAPAPDVQLVGQGEIQPAPTPAITDVGDSDEAPPPRKPGQPLPPGHGHPGGDPDPDPHKPPGKPKPEWTPSVQVFDPKITLGNDPQLAVGMQAVIGIDSGLIVFYDKHGAQLATKPVKHGTPFQTRISANDFFAVFMIPHIGKSKAKNPLDVNFTIPNVKNKTKELGCDPEDPTRLGGCVVEAYDTRVIYDGPRGKFWIESHLRNKVQSGSNCDPKKTACVDEGSPLHQRFIVIAVSKTEDPRDGFDSSIFAIKHPGDWPRLAVHHNFLVLGANGNTDIHLFDADRLAKPGADPKRISLGDFNGSDFGDPDYVYPVIQHDEGKDVPTYLVATNGSRVTVFAFDDFNFDQPENGALLGPKLHAASLELDEDAPHLMSPAVYRNGMIYMAGAECIDGSYPTCLAAVRMLIIPVIRTKSGITLSKSVNVGFNDLRIGGTKKPGGSFEIPAIEVNHDGDIALVYARSEPGAIQGLRLPFEAGAFFTVYINGQYGRKDGTLHEASCKTGLAELGCAVANPVAAHLDVAGIAVDPADDTTFWMSHGFASGDAGHYAMVIGAVTARGKQH